MAVLGRILQIIGWLWIIVGFFGSLINLGGVNVFPGFIVLLISRAIRRQASRRSLPGDHDLEGEDHVEEQPEPRPLNTEREQRPAPEPRPLNTEREQRSASEPNPTPAVPSGPRGLKPVPEPEDRGDLLERVLLAGKEVVEEPHEPGDREINPDIDPGAGSSEDRPLTSEEMIAQAHRRWDRRDS